ncbi:uncharacterized protein LOC124336247 [Daphnia pulicaria]|uniref:uncharacterized protein LOC124336247 n=1 Tax=Daphnia pulicaria TaxID=35523 RepID=UPI001EEA7B24|nr:uncharacterized protein LOC124336247 [Daphnia pulicaria]
MAISLAVADLPVNLRSIQPYLEIADDYESNDPCISYWCRLYALKQGFILERVEEDLSFLLVLMEVLGKNKQDLQSKIEITDIPVARAHLEGATQKLLSWAENVPPLESLTKSETLTCVVAKVFQSAAMLLDVRFMFGEPNEGEFEKKNLLRYRYTELHGKNSHREFHSGSTTKKSNIWKLSENLVDRTSREIPNDEQKKNTESPLTTAMDDDQNQAQSQKVTKQDERKKIYGRLFLLQLLNHPVSQKKPEGLPSLEIVRNKMGRNQIIADKLLGVHQQQYQQSPNVNPKTIDLIYSVVHKDREEQKMELKNSQFQEPFIPMDRRSRDSIDYRWTSVHNSDSRGGNVKLDITQLRILKVPARDADQAVTSLDTGGKGLISWGQVTSSGMAQSLIGGVGGEKQHSVVQLHPVKLTLIFNTAWIST